MNADMPDDAERGYWDRHATNDDRSMAILGRPLPRMCALVAEELRGAREVLEIGAGTGLVTQTVAEVAEHVVATDYAEAMVRRLRERVAAAGLSNVECLTRDLHALGFEAGRFDAVVCANVLHLVPDIAGAIAALRVPLRPGGKIIAPTFCHGETILSRLASYGIALTGFPGHRRFTSDGLRRTFESEGFRVLRHETIPGLFPIGFVACVAGVQGPAEHPSPVNGRSGVAGQEPTPIR